MPHSRVIVMGQGYVGLPVSVAAVESGHRVFGIEVDADRLADLNAGRSYVEDISSPLLEKVIATGLISFHADPAEAGEFDVAVIAVPTPLTDGEPDLSYVVSAARSLAPTLRPGVTVVLESTSYPGTTEDVLAKVLEAGSGLTPGADFALGYSPERIDPGNGKWTFVTTPKVVSGVDEDSLHKVAAFYKTMIDVVVPVSGTREAEFAKLLENTFRHVNIALVNELAQFAQDDGIDVWESIRAASSKPFGFMPFLPGPGVGGHCIPVDPVYLSWLARKKHGKQLRLIGTAQEINDGMPQYVVTRLDRAMRERGLDLGACRILIIGLSYKANISDIRETPARHICAELTARGAQVVAVEPYLDEAPPDIAATLVAATAEEIAKADAVVLLAAHDELDYRLVTEHATFVLDTRDRLPRDTRHVERL